MSRPVARTLLLVAMIACAGQAGARSSDRNQPMNLEANNQECSLEENGQCIFTGNVVITQGTLELRAAKAVIHRKDGQPSRAVLTGSPATMKQEMDDGTPMDARAQSIDYDIIAEVVTMVGDVRVVQPRGTMTGARLVYNTKSGQVNSGNTSGNERVRMVIQPKNAQAPAAGSKPAPAPAKPAPAKKKGGN